MREAQVFCQQSDGGFAQRNHGSIVSESGAIEKKEESRLKNENVQDIWSPSEGSWRRARDTPQKHPENVFIMKELSLNNDCRSEKLHF